VTDDFRAGLERAMSARPARRVDPQGARRAAVLIPVVALPEPSLIFTVRTHTLPSHRGEISFPGGSIDDSDASPKEAALREANEEVGLDPGLVEVVGEIDNLHTFVSGYVISPFVGWIAEPPKLLPNPAEVATVLEVPIAGLTDAIRSESGFARGGRTYPTEAWVWGEDVIWGITGRILRLFLERLAEAGLIEGPAPPRDPWPEPARP